MKLVDFLFSYSTSKGTDDNDSNNDLFVHDDVKLFSCTKCIDFCIDFELSVCSKTSFNYCDYI